MDKLLNPLRRILHQSEWYWESRAIQGEGFTNARHRIRHQRSILNTAPIDTETIGAQEVRLLTYRGDWLNAIWALKTFYYFSEVRFRLHIHDGGLLPHQVTSLQRHFPRAFFHPLSDTTRQVERLMSSRRLPRCIEYRRKNNHTYKFFDFYLLSKADRVIVIDSDVLFFRMPRELLERSNEKTGPNLYNKDFQYAYALAQGEMNRLAGRTVKPYLNSGVGCVAPESLRIDFAEECLAVDALFNTYGVVEQTLHALCCSSAGFDFLPDTYIVSTEAGLPPATICKHYPTAPRPLLYQEGMFKLAADGFLNRRRDQLVSRRTNSVE